MDEPFTNLDRDGRQLISEIVEEHLSQGGLCVMAAHQNVDINAKVIRVSL
jgi:ABC-type transport system involved in cytochrome c biogenesis ATPase subunit